MTGQLEDQPDRSIEEDPGRLLARLLAVAPVGCRQLVFADPAELSEPDRDLQRQLWAAGPAVEW